MTLLQEIIVKCSPEILATHDTQAITDAFNVGHTKVATKLGGIGLVLETLGPDNGAALLDGLQAMTTTVPALKWAWYLIERGELDFGSPATRGMIDTLVAQGAIAEPLGTALKAAAEVPDPIDELTIRKTVLADDGTWSI